MKKYIGLGYLAMLLCAPLAHAGTAQDAAYDDRNHAVMDERGNCVRTKWMGENDPCAPAPAPKEKVAAAPAPAPAPVPTPAPAPEPQVIASKEARTVYFDFNKADLTQESKDKLTALATVINTSNRVTSVHMVGFTDQYGTSDYNQKLSQQRVDAVRSYLDPLITLSIDPATAEFRAAGKAPGSKCDAVKSRPERIVCMKEERRVEVELGVENVK